MRKVLSLSFLLLLALVFSPGCARKQQVEEDAYGTGNQPEAEAGAKSATEGCGEETPAAEPEEGGGEETPAAEPEEGGGEETPAAEPEEGGGEETPSAEPEEGGGEETPAAEPEEGGGEETPAAKPEEAAPTPEPQAGIPDDAIADREQMMAVKKRMLALAEAKYKAGDLEAARDLYRRVLLLDNRDAAAREAYMRLSQELGERMPIAEGVVETEASRVSARLQQTKVEIKRRLAEARLAEEGGDYDTAIRKYEEIVYILDYYKYQADFPVTSAQARGMIAQAKEQRRLQADRQRAKIAKEALDVEQSRKERARREDMRRMGVFLQMASDAYDRGEYDLAEGNASKVLALDPQNEAARELIRIARETKYVSDRNDIRERFNDQWRTIMEQLEFEALPHTEIISYPDNWEMISRRRPRKTGTGTVAAPDARSERIANTLAQTRVYEINWEGGEINLKGAVQYLRSVTGLNFVLSQKVKDDKADTEIDLTVDDVSVAQVLDIVTESNEMAWKIRNGVVMLLDKDEALDKAVLQFYDVKDLVAKLTDFPGQEINLVPSKFQPPEPPEPPEPTSAFEVDQLVDVIKLTIEPESWDTIEGANIDPKSGVLVVTTTPAIQEKIGRFLSDLRKNTGLLVSIEVRFLTAEDRFLRDVGVDVRGLGDQTGGVGLPGLGTKPGRDPITNFDDTFTGSTANPSGSPSGVIPEPASIGTSRTPGAFFGDGADGEYKARTENLFDFILGFDEPGQATASAAAGGVRGANSGGFTLQHTYLDDTQLEVILRAVEKSERIEQINAPRLTVYDTQRANVSVLKQTSYVQDFDVEIAQAAAIGDPIIQTIRDGIILDVRPIVSADRRFITMEMRPTVADLVRPIPTFQTTLATGPPVTIQVPEIAISRVRTTVTMPDGGTLLLGGIKFFRDLVGESGVPVLSKIPVLSFLFTRKAKTVQRRNLLILIKAEVVVPEEHAPGLGVSR